MIRIAIRTIVLCASLVAASSAALAQEPVIADPTVTAGDVLDVVPLGRTSPEAIQAAARPLFAGYGAPVVEYAVDAYRVHFATTDLDGSLTPVAAQIFVPVLEAGDAPIALYAFGAGTTGVGFACAPSRESEYGHPIGHYAEYLNAYAGRGFVSVIPDYLGFDDPTRPQAYFHAVAEGRVLLDAIRATYRFLAQQAPGVPTPEHVFAAGYSQGGHAAYAAADLRSVYAPDVPLHGMIGFAPTTNVERLLREGPYYAPYIAVSYASAYGLDTFDPAAILHPSWVPTLRTDAERLCVDVAQSHYPYDVRRIYHPSFAASLIEGRLAETHPSIKRVLDANRTGLTDHGLPSMIVQGGKDIIVRDATQEAFLEASCAAGNPTHYVYYPEARHRHTRPAGFEDSIAWMKNLASGGPVPSSCALVASDGRR